MVTVILNGYKRPHFLKKQVDAIKNQTVKVDEIMLWQNDTNGFDDNITNTLITAASNKNFGVWARFAFALNASNEYICILDDDTIPGNQWIENCLNTIQIHNGLLGTIGLQYESDKSYLPNIRIGWDNPNETTQQVDIVGHAWFFRKEWLTTYWRELPLNGYNNVGEDMHFSYTLQKYLGINTFVPPHPKDNKEMWGSTKGWEMGREQNAISLKSENIIKMNEYYLYLISKGFKILKNV